MHKLQLACIILQFSALNIRQFSQYSLAVHCNLQSISVVSIIRIHLAIPSILSDRYPLLGLPRVGVLRTQKGVNHDHVNHRGSISSGSSPTLWRTPRLKFTFHSLKVACDESEPEGVCTREEGEWERGKGDQKNCCNCRAYLKANADASTDEFK